MKLSATRGITAVRIAFAAAVAFGLQLQAQGIDPTASPEMQMLQAMQLQQLGQAQAAVPVKAAGPLGAKKPGVPRVGVLLPRVDMGQGTTMAELGEPLRQTQIRYLSGPAVEVIPLDSRAELQVAAEAKQKECDFVLRTVMQQTKKSSDGWRKAMATVAPMASMIPMVGMMGTAGAAVATGAVAASVGSAAMGGLGAFAQTTRAKDQVSYEYTLYLVADRSVAATNSSKVTAKKDGEDVLTPLVEQSSEAILNRVQAQK